MINAEKLTFGFNTAPLFQNISFTLEENCHCALIGSNGTGKTTLMNLIRQPERYTFDGKLKLDNTGRMGYVSQFAAREGISLPLSMTTCARIFLRWSAPSATSACRWSPPTKWMP